MKLQSKNLALVTSYTYLVINTVASLVMSSCLIKSLGATDYGVYQIVTSFTGYLALLNFGTGTIMTRNIVAAKVKKDASEYENISTITWMTVAISGIMLLLSFVLYLFFDNIYGASLTTAQISQAKPMFLIVSLNLALSLLFQTFEGIVHGNDDYTSPKLFSIANVLIRCSVIIGLIQVINSAMVIVLTDLFLRIAGLLFMLIVSKKWYVLHKIFAPKLFKTAIFKASISFALAMILQVFVNQSITQIPKSIIGIVISPEAVTTFSIVIYIYNIFSSVLTVPISIFLPTTVRAITNKQKSEIDWSFLEFPCRINSLLGGTILFGFIALGRQFITLLYGEEQIEAWLLTVIMLVAMYVNMLLASCVNVLDALNKRLVRSLIIAASAALSILITIVSLKQYGIIAAAIAIGISLIINTIATSIYYKKSIGINVMKLYWQAIKGPLPCCVIAGAATFFLSKIVPVSFFWFICLGAFFAVVLVACLLLFGFNKQEKEMLKKYLKKILKK